jgi:hypothetical protein
MVLCTCAFFVARWLPVTYLPAVSRGEWASLLADIRAVLTEARDLLDGAGVVGSRGLGRTSNPGRASVTALYDELRQRLAEIDGSRIDGLLGRVTEQVETLNRIGAELEGLRRAVRSLHDA